MHAKINQSDSGNAMHFGPSANAELYLCFDVRSSDMTSEFVAENVAEVNHGLR
jgi:hypothetical protein